MYYASFLHTIERERESVVAGVGRERGVKEMHLKSSRATHKLLCLYQAASWKTAFHTQRKRERGSESQAEALARAGSGVVGKGGSKGVVT